MSHTILTTITCYTEIHTGIKDGKQKLTSNACTGGSKLFNIFTEMPMEAKKNWEDMINRIPALLAIMPGTLRRLESFVFFPSSRHISEVGGIEP